eukprot:c44426_g1_i1 orf=116-349(+)
MLKQGSTCKMLQVHTEMPDQNSYTKVHIHACMCVYAYISIHPPHLVVSPAEPYLILLSRTQPSTMFSHSQTFTACCL